MNIFEAQPQEAFPLPCVTQEQRLSPTQQANIDQDDMARLHRIPPMGEDRVPMMTLRELLDWKADWHAKRRPPTKSERLDFDECGRQLDEVASETTMDWEEFDRNEQEMDTCPSPTQRNHPAWTKDYQIGRELRKRPLSPPRTPPHLRGPGLYRQQHSGLAPNGGSYRITKGKRDYAKTPRRPITRSTATPKISLHDRKGYVKFWHTMTQYVVISYEKYLRDYVSLGPMCYVCVSNLGSRIEKSLISTPLSQWTALAKIQKTHTRLTTSGRYAGGSRRERMTP